MTPGISIHNNKEAMENRVVLLDQIEINLFAIIDSSNDWSVQDETAIHIDFDTTEGAKANSDNFYSA